ncbi:MAG: hypothetical protein WA210_13375, partial [Burkholderiaceae bacterium]
MKLLVKTLFATLMVLLLAVLAVVWLAFDDVPLLAPGPQVSVADVQRAQRFLKRHDPRKGKAGAPRQVALSQADLDVLLTQAAQRLGQASSRLVLRNAGASWQASARVERSPFGAWLNIDAQLRETTGLPRVDELRIGSLTVPGWLADFALEQAIAHLEGGEAGRIAADMVQHVRFTPKQLRVSYTWREDL